MYPIGILPTCQSGVDIAIARRQTALRLIAAIDLSRAYCKSYISNTPMKTRAFITLSFVAFVSAATARQSWPAADQLEEFHEEQSEDRQKRKLEELKRRHQLQILKRDQQIQQYQRELDELKHSKSDDPKTQQRSYELQGRLDQLRNEQQLERVQRELEFNRIQREQNAFRQQEQIRELQRQQQMDFLRDQSRKSQQDVDRLR
jgi:hypothetical protein